MIKPKKPEDITNIDADYNGAANNRMHLLNEFGLNSVWLMGTANPLCKGLISAITYALVNHGADLNGEEMRFIREHGMQMTQPEMALLIGVTPQQLLDIEAKDQEMPDEQVQRMLKIVCLSLISGKSALEILQRISLKKQRPVKIVCEYTNMWNIYRENESVNDVVLDNVRVLASAFLMEKRLRFKSSVLKKQTKDSTTIEITYAINIPEKRAAGITMGVEKILLENGIDTGKYRVVVRGNLEKIQPVQSADQYAIPSADRPVNAF